MKAWSKFWKGSSQKRKQRKYAHNAPLHIKHKFLGASLAKELRTEYSTRTLPVRKGDTVKVISGQFKDQSGKVSKVVLARSRVYVDGLGVKRSDGTLALYPIHPSNLRITKLDTSDKARVAKLEKLKKMNGGKKE